ncbi:hypothetical protein VCHENC02_5316 [Vibrio harveyi]|uniref:Uncharacterized protein n=1 Tax=Vibrio harveyi TaxID=669 RepID=A0A454CQY0_VIBHA|nr:hypothetical protein VCHENC02_5316 [Vibrio harveyi]
MNSAKIVRSDMSPNLSNVQEVLSAMILTLPDRAERRRIEKKT